MESQSLLVNAALFVAASAVIWWAGIRLERLADQLAVQTGLGHAFVGVALLAAATSLPEVATTVTAIVILDNPTLAVHNLLGGVALQTGLLILADLAQRERGALTFFTPRYSLLLQGVGLVFLLQFAITGVAAKGTPTVWSISIWSVLLFASQLLVMYLTYRHRGHPRWTPSDADDTPDGELPRDAAPADEKGQEDDQTPASRLWLGFAGASALVLVGGWLATSTAEVLAEQTGLGPAFLGATLLAAATSMPEISTTFTAARTGRYTLAISNIFGSNAFDVSLLFWADLLWRQGSVLAHAEMTVVFVAGQGSAMTCLFLWGLMERENRTVGRLGWDSVAALILYLGGVTVLYFIQ
jgi:cation:H+ antiporter